MATPLSKAEQHRRRIQEAYQKIFNTPDGAIVLADLRLRTAFDEPTYKLGLEPWQPAYRDGAQSTFRYILEIIQSEPNTNQTPTITKPSL